MMYKRLKKSAYAFDNKGTIHRVFVLTLACLVHGLCSNVGMATMRYLTIPKMSDGASKRIPNVTLLDQDGKKVRFYTDLVQDKTVIISFIFTTCTASCSSVGATFARMQSLLRDKPGRDIHLISITIDPETDTPFRLREWAAQFGAAPGWTLLTGSQRDIDDLTKSLTGSVKRKGLHTPEVIIGSDARDVWVHTYALDKPSNILEEAETAGFRQQALVGSFPDDFSTGPVGSPGNKARRIAAVALPDGRADVFMVGIDGHLWHSVQTSPNGNFPDFAGAPVGSSANVATDIAAVRMADGHIEVFMVGTDGRMWRSPQQPNGSFPDFAQRPVGSPANKAQRIAVVALPDGRADVFMVGLDQHMWHSVQTSPNGSFPDFANAPVGSPANLATDIAAARMPDGHIEAFMVGTDGHMWRSPQQSNGSFPDFAQRLVGNLANRAQRIVAVALTDGRADVFMVGIDGHMWHSVQSSPNGSFPDFAWQSVGSPSNLSIEIKAVRRPDSHTEIFMVGTDGRMWRSLDVFPPPPEQAGQWSDILDWQFVAVHMSLLPNGRVLLWSRYNTVSDDIPTGDDGSKTPHARVWDPVTGNFQEIPNPYTNLFCSGHTLLPDGRVFVNGGHYRSAGGAGDLGVCDTNLFSLQGAGGTWSKAADMNYERWYSTVLSLPNGDAMAIGGSYGGAHRDLLPNQPVEVWQRGGWTGFQNLVGSASNLATQIAAVRLPDGHVEVFMVGRDAHMWRSSQHSDGSFPDDFAQKPVGSSANRANRIAAVTLPDGRIDAFMVGIDGHMWHSVQTSPNGNFPDFAGAPVGSSANVATDIAAVRMADGHIEVFMVGTDGRMWRSPQQPNGSFPDFAQRPVGSPANKAQRIAVVARPDGRADVFMVGLDQHMWHSVQSSPNGSFPDFANAPVGSPANLATDIAAARMPDGHIEVFMVGIDGHMWRSPQQSNGSFPDFADRPFGYSRNLAIRIVVVPFSDGRRDVYMVRQDQTMWRNFETTDYGWRELTGIGRTTNNDTGWYMYYPWAYVAPNGKVFIAGPTKKTFWIDAQGNGSLAPGPASSVFRDYGSSVMYDVGKILILGGGTTGQNQAYGSAQTIDLNGSGVWVDAGSMNHPRKHANATILPNGQVLVVGGTTLGGDPSRDYEQFNRFVLDAEVWDPTTNRWSLMAGMRIPRTYHSTAVLLPSGRVLVAGGGQGGGLDAHPSAEIYSPNYLFRGPRPVIASAPASVRYNRSFDVVTAEAQAITGVTLVSLGSTTHAYNQSQRFNRLHFTRNAGKVTATAPSGGNICPPGYYMLFILNGDGIPSEAKIVRVSN